MALWGCSKSFHVLRRYPKTACIRSVRAERIEKICLNCMTASSADGSRLFHNSISASFISNIHIAISKQFSKQQILLFDFNLLLPRI